MKRVDLVLYECGGCGLVQSLVDPPDGYYDDYAYTLANTESETRHNEEFVNELMGERLPSNVICEIGCGEGALLSKFRDRGNVVLGVEPSKPLAIKAMENRIYVRNATVDLFTVFDMGPDILGALVLQQVLDHLTEVGVNAIHFFFSLKPGGLIAIETGDLDEILKTGDIGSFTHEHLTYWTFDTLKKWLEDAEFVNVRRVDVKERRAASMVVFANRPDAKSDGKDTPPPGARYASRDPWDDLMKGATRLREFCEKYDVRGYGAGGRGTNWINSAGLTSAYMPYVVDDVLGGTGALVPGTDILIGWWERAVPRGVTVVVFSYGYMDEITKRLRDHGFGGRIVSVLDIVSGRAS